MPAEPVAATVVGELRARDAAAVAARPATIRAHSYEGGWYNNATFVLPLLASLGSLIGWAVLGGTELLGISIFFLIVTGVMLPLVWLTWQRTPTVIVLGATQIEALHQGEARQALPWSEVQAVRRMETMGNVRWYVVGAEEAHLTLEGEIAGLDTLLAEARRLAGLDEPAEPSD